MPRRYAMDTRQAATAEIVGRILDATLDELAAAGGITLHAVAARADVALRTLYNHFAGREELLAAAFAHHAAQTRAQVEALTVPPTDPEEQLRHLVQAYHARYARMGARLSVLLSVSGFPELDEQIRKIRHYRSHLLAQIIDRAQQASLLRVPPDTAAALAFTLTSHAGWQTLRDHLNGDDTATTRLATEALCSALFHH